MLDFPTLTTVKTTGAAGFPDTAPAEIGQDFSWRIVVTNTSATATASAVHVADTLPANWTYSGPATLVPGGPQAPQIVSHPTGDTLGWVVPVIPPQSTVTITFAARPTLAAAANPGLGAGAQVNSARVDSATDEAGNSGNADGPYATPADTASATLLRPVLTIAKTPDRGSATAGTPSSFTVAIANTGSGTARNVDVADVFPAGLVYTRRNRVGSSVDRFQRDLRRERAGCGRDDGALEDRVPRRGPDGGRHRPGRRREQRPRAGAC